VDQRRTLIAFESARRLPAALEDIRLVLGNRDIAVARELTKLHEEIWRGPVSGARERFSGKVRGEITLVIAGASEPPPWNNDQVQEAVTHLRDQGQTHKEAVKEIARVSGRSRRDVYQLTIKREDMEDDRDV
jgi:16S rRNA (cytidine1402-2'-O)-methyltransferase